MKTTRLSAAILIVAGAAIATAARAQQAAAGLEFDLSGTWTLDSYLSDSAEEVAHELRADTSQGASAFASGPFGEPTGTEGTAGKRGEGGEHGVFGGSRDRRGPDRDEPLRSDEQKMLDALTNDVQFASPTLTISEAGTQLTIVSTRGGTRTIRTDGTTEKQSLGAVTVNRTARWEGPQLVVSYDVGHAGTLTYRYLLVPTTKQLLVRVNFERIRGTPGPFDIKLVYNRAGG